MTKNLNLVSQKVSSVFPAKVNEEKKTTKKTNDHRAEKSFPEEESFSLLDKNERESRRRDFHGDDDYHFGAEN